MIKLKKTLTVVLCIILIFLGAFSVSAEENESLIAPDWVSERTNYDGSITLVISTPVHMLDFVDYYEYSFDSLTWSTLSDKTGGEFIITETCEFSLRYVHDNITSETYTVSVVIEKTVAVTSDSTGITMIIPRDSAIPTDITLSAYEIINGSYYTAAEALIGKNKPFMLFSVTVMRNNKIFTYDTEAQWLFPIRNFDYRYCKLYHIGDDGSMTEISAEPEFKVLYCTTEFTGKFAVVEDKTNSPGDINGDALVNASDARLALRAAAQLENLNEIQFKAADIDSDGKVTSADARRILRISAGLDKI